MTKRKSMPGPGQETMFIQGNINPRLEEPVDLNAVRPPEPTPQPKVTEQKYPSVDLVERAEHLQVALRALGAHSSGTGLQLKDEFGGKPFRRELVKRYGDSDTAQQVVDGVQNSKNRNLLKAKRHFSDAIGTSAMIASGLQTTREAVDSETEDWGKFQQKHADKKGAPAREELRKKIHKTIREQAKLRSERRVS